MLMMIKDGKGPLEDVNDASNEPYLVNFLKCLEDRRVSIENQESLAVEAANSLMSKLRAQLEPFRYVADEASPWEEKSAVARFANKVHKSKRNKVWRKKKRKRIAEMLAKVTLPWFVFVRFFLCSSLLLLFETNSFVWLLSLSKNSRNVSSLTELTEKLMNGGLGRLPRILQVAR